MTRCSIKGCHKNLINLNQWVFVLNINSSSSISQLVMLVCSGEHWTLPKGWSQAGLPRCRYQPSIRICQLIANSGLRTVSCWRDCRGRGQRSNDSNVSPKLSIYPPRSLLFPTLMPSQDFFIENINLSLNHFICRDDEELFQIDFQIQIIKVECKCIPFFSQLANCNSWSWEYY